MKMAFSLLLFLSTSLSLNPQAFAIDFADVVESSQLRSVLALGAIRAEDQKLEVFCSAVAIHPRIVLTAAHCLQEGARRLGRKDQNGLTKTLRLFLGSEFPRGIFTESRITTDSIFELNQAFVHPDYGRSFRGQFDLAVLVLKKNLPLVSEDYPELALDALELKQTVRKGSLLQVSGFGWSKKKSLVEPKNRQDFGIKKTAFLPVDGVTSDEVFLGPGPANSRGDLFRSRPREGDSGGPLFAENSGRKALVGLVSRSAVIRDELPIAAFTLIRPSICWIQNVTKTKLLPPNSFDFCAREFRRREPQPLHPHESFEMLCEKKDDLHLQDQYTLEVLSRIHHTSSCQVLNERLRNSLTLNLDRTGVRSLQLLNFFPHFERISIRDNDLEVLRLVGHPQLRFIDVSYNNIRVWPPKIGHSDLWIVGQERQFHSLGRTHFIKLCGSPSATPEQKRTVRALLDQMQMGEKDCVNANYELARSRSLKLKSGQWLKDLSPLQGLLALESLDVSGQDLTALDFLQELPALNRLNVDGNPIADWSDLKHLKNLENLSARNTGLTDLSFLDDTPRLQTLDISFNHITSFEKSEPREKRGILRVIGKDLQGTED